MAVEAVNSDENILQDYEIVLLQKDTQCKADLVMKQFIYYVENETHPVVGILGEFFFPSFFLPPNHVTSKPLQVPDVLKQQRQSPGCRSTTTPSLSVMARNLYNSQTEKSSRSFSGLCPQTLNLGQ